jgi:mannose-1-phosphate guanylyltransferase
MRIVLLSGGSGKRLWPLSNDSRSKQFLKILNDKDGNHISMLQRVFQQLETLQLHKSSVIATSKAQVGMIQSQLSDNIPIVIEPARRDTFPAIALSSVYLYSKQRANLEDVVVVLPVDPYVENDFFKNVTLLENVLLDSSADIALMGVRPSFPSSKYGYIIPEPTNGKRSYFDVRSFKEKPSEDEAKKLIKQNALWNCGVFAFKLDFIIKLLIDLGFPVEYEELLEQYNLLPKNSFDYEVVEKTKKITVQPYEGYWKDLGTWNTLTEEMESSVFGRGKISRDSHNTHLINELDIPIAILGASNLVVAASPDGILVSEKSASPRLKEMISDFDQRPMYEERLWGWYKVLDYTKYDEGIEVLTKRICIHANKNLSYQLHDKRSEVWTIIKGHGEIIIEGNIRNVSTGDVIEIPKGIKHAVKADSDMEIIEVQRGSELIEEDIIRLENEWEEIIEIFVNESQSK